MSAVVTQAVELAACPFCGERPGIGDPFVLHPENGCVLAGYEFGDWHKPRTEAITAWNQRHRSEAVEELVEALKEARGQVVGFMLECGHSPETAVANVARLDAVLSKHRGEQG